MRETKEANCLFAEHLKCQVFTNTTSYKMCMLKQDGFVLGLLGLDDDGGKVGEIFRFITAPREPAIQSKNLQTRKTFFTTSSV